MYEDQNNNYVYYQMQPTEQPAAPIQNQGKKKGKTFKIHWCYMDCIKKVTTK